MMVIGLMIIFAVVMYSIGKKTHDTTVEHIAEADTSTERNLWAGCGAMALIVLVVVIFFGAAFMASVTRGM